MTTAKTPSPLSRRGLLAFGVAAGAATSACAAPAAKTASTPPPLTKGVTEGPYYIAGAPSRADIAEDLGGLPVELVFEVLDETGAPLSDATVDVWHCDAQGRYSGFGAAPGEEPDAALKAARFLRGVQSTGADGRARFRTVYPGWYRGRTTHIHYKVWRQGRQLLTSQVFLPDALNEFLYTQSADYRRDGTRDTLNRNDFIAREGGETALGAVAETEDRFRVDFTVVVDRAARPAAERGPGGPPPGGFRGPPPEGFGGGPPPGGPPPGGPRGETLSGEARTAALLPPPRKGGS